MAEELIIRVKIDGQEGTGEGGRREGVRDEALGAGAAALIARNIRKENFEPLEKKLKSQISRAEQDALERPFNPSGPMAGELKNLTLQSKGVFRSDYSMEYWETGVENPGLLGDMQFKSFRGSHVEDYLAKNQRRIKALGAATALKTAHSAISVANHRSGDVSKVESRNRTVKFMGYGAALAVSGPAAGFVAAGIAVNEVVNTISHRMNYKYDRALEGSKIRNIAASAGDLAYGRRRGGM